ncbi:MAG: NAD-dependent epimerase/dehydratase family protein [Nitrospirota bacterium]
MELKGKRVLITGASGFVGRHLCSRLIKQGSHVRALIRNLSKASFIADNVEVVQGDVKDAMSLKVALRGCQVVFHLASVLAHENKPLSEFYNVNVKGTRIIADEALNASVDRFIYMSTSWVYGYGCNRQYKRKFASSSQ